MDRPKIFRTSTRNKSVHGDQRYPRANSCTRNKRPRAKISAPREMVFFAMRPRGWDLWRMRCVTKAMDIPARKMKSGAGKVAAICDQRYRPDFFAPGLSQEL